MLCQGCLQKHPAGSFVVGNVLMCQKQGSAPKFYWIYRAGYKMPCGEAGRLPGAHPHATLLWLIPENIVLYTQGHGVSATMAFLGGLVPPLMSSLWGQAGKFSLVILESRLGVKSKVEIKPFLHLKNFEIWVWSEDEISASPTHWRAADVHGCLDRCFHNPGYSLLRNWDCISVQ